MEENKKIGIAVVIFLVVIAVGGAFAVNMQLESLDDQNKKYQQEEQERKQEITEFKEYYKSLSCEQMREEIFNDSIPFGYGIWAEERYKWKPCYEVILDD